METVPWFNLIRKTVEGRDRTNDPWFTRQILRAVASITAGGARMRLHECQPSNDKRYRVNPIERT